MVGWHISVFRQAEGGSLPATPTTKQAYRIAVWRASVGGLNWLDELAAQGNAIKLGGDGYPYWYTAQAAHLISRITDQPPEARTFPVVDFDHTSTGWETCTAIDPAVTEACRPTEWLLIEAWDES